MKISTANMPMTAARHSGANRIAAQRRAHGALFEILDAGRQGARAQNHGQVFGLLLGEAPVDYTLIVDLIFDDGDFLNLVVEHDGEIVADVSAGKAGEATATFAGQSETHRRLSVLVAGLVGGAQIAARHCRGARNQIPSLSAIAHRWDPRCGPA